MSLAVLVACVLIMTPMGLMIVGVRKGIREVQDSLIALSNGDLTQISTVHSRDEKKTSVHAATFDTNAHQMKDSACDLEGEAETLAGLVARFHF